jgi:hypothetical protein
MQLKTGLYIETQTHCFLLNSFPLVFLHVRLVCVYWNQIYISFSCALQEPEELPVESVSV